MKVPFDITDIDFEDLSPRELMRITGQITDPDYVLDSKRVDLFLCSDHTGVENLVEELVKSFLTSGIRTGHISKLKPTLNMIISNFLEIERMVPERYLAYSRTSNEYTSRYNPSGIGYHPMMNAVDGLIKLELVENIPGTNRGDTGGGYVSRMKPSSILGEKLASIDGFSFSDLHQITSERETIKLKDENGYLINYTDTCQTNDMRSLLSRYNEGLRDTEISLSDDCSEEADLSRNQCHRTFNDGSFELGGRFYGPWWQYIKKEARPHILINGNVTSEYDYSSLIVHQIYSMEGIKYCDVHGAGDDPYSLPGYDWPRGYLKKVFFLMLNTPSMKRAKVAIDRISMSRSDIDTIGNPDVQKLMDDVLTKHEAIKDKFFIEPATRLQFQDSQICESVIKFCMDEGITVLTIHDSFIVENQHEETIRRIMEDACVEHGMISIPTITKTP